MLQSDVIPVLEPTIRVGIVFPEDKIGKLELSIPENDVYTITSSAIQKTLTRGKIVFRKKDDKIHCSGMGIDTSWLLSESPERQIKPYSGIKVAGILAGRGFHWQKLIDVHLPGKLEFATNGGQLILINELPLEKYLMCVATSEMSARCPSAFLETQTIAARSWILANVEKKHIHLGFDVCNDDCCQRYQGTGQLTRQSIRGAEHTRGQVLLYQDHICDARYSKSCGGMMERFSTIWDGQDYDYLQVTPDTDQTTAKNIAPLNSEQLVIDWINQVPPSFCSSRSIAEKKLHKYLGQVDEKGKYFRWQVVYTQSEICNLLNEKLNIAAQAILDLVPLARGGSGRIIRLQITYLDDKGKESKIIVQRDVHIRRALHKEFLYSSCIYFSKKTGTGNFPSEFIIHGAGWGHGVGLCQIGALGMALQGHVTAEILDHYYPGSILTTIYK
jgi:stage II sporulation protein D